MNRFSEFGNDEISHMIFFILVFFLFKISVKKEIEINDLKNLSILSVFIFLIKGIYILIAILGIYLLTKIILKKIFFDRLIFFLIFVLSLWIIKNIIVSGCMIFPITFTCIDNLAWSNNEAVFQTLETEAWAKSFPDSNMKLSYEKYISGFGWMSVWLKKHFVFILKKISIVFFLIFILLIFSNVKKVNLKNIKLNFLLIFLFFCILFWLLKFPVYRFGAGYIYSFISVLIASHFIFDETKLKKVGNILLILIFTTVLLKNFNRIKNEYKKKYIEYPWIKIYSADNNQKNNFTKINFKNSKDFFYFYPNGKLCFYSPGLCSYKKTNNLQIMIKKKYKIIIKN